MGSKRCGIPKATADENSGDHYPLADRSTLVQLIAISSVRLKSPSKPMSR